MCYNNDNGIVRKLKGDEMKKFDKVTMIIEEKGVITSEEAREENISVALLKQWVDRGKLERVSRGVYSLPHSIVDSLYVFQLRCKKGIFSHETALLLHNLSDRIPTKCVMTVPEGYNTHRFNKNSIDFHWCNKNIHDLGVINIISTYGNELRVYDLERTICDIIKYRSSMDPAIFKTAIQNYIEKSDKKRFKLSLYAKKLGVTNKVNQVLGVYL